MSLSFPGHDAMLMGAIDAHEDGIFYDDAVNEAGGELSFLDDAELVNTFIDHMGQSSWDDVRESLIEDALELAAIPCDRDWEAEGAALKAMDLAALLPRCREHMGAVKERHRASYCMPERTVTHWDAWRADLIESMQETVFIARRDAANADAY